MHTMCCTFMTVHLGNTRQLQHLHLGPTPAAVPVPPYRQSSENPWGQGGGVRGKREIIIVEQFIQ